MNKEDEPNTYKREWLNEGEGTAYVVIDYGIAHYDSTPSLDISLEIKDCSRSVNLDFYANDEEHRIERLAKMDKLIGLLSEIREFINSNKLLTKEEIKVIKDKKKSTSKRNKTITTPFLASDYL